MKLTKQTFEQEMHCCGDANNDQATLTLELHDGGGGDYLVMHAAHWAFSDEREIRELTDKMIALLAAK